jgi:hypothetical protein
LIHRKKLYIKSGFLIQRVAVCGHCIFPIASNIEIGFGAQALSDKSGTIIM